MGCSIRDIKATCSRGTMHPSHHVQGEDPFDPEGVANSIKALALSVQDTGMFGDLPKPRWNSSFHAR